METCLLSRLNWNLEVLVFKEKEKPLRTIRERTNNKLNPHNGVDIKIQTRATLVGGECSHHCDTLAPHVHVLVQLRHFAIKGLYDIFVNLNKEKSGFLVPHDLYCTL